MVHYYAVCEVARCALNACTYIWAKINDYAKVCC